MKREKKRKEKEAKKLARAENKNSLDDDSMIAYVDQYGNITDTPPDPEEREEINAEDIELGIPKKEKIEGDEIREAAGDQCYRLNDPFGADFVDPTIGGQIHGSAGEQVSG